MILNKIMANKILLLIFILALVLRLGILGYTYDHNFYGGLTVWHGESARNLIEGRGYVINEEFLHFVQRIQHESMRLCDFQDLTLPEQESFIQNSLYPPGYASLLSFTYILFGAQRYIYLQIIQAIIDSFGIFLIFSIGKTIFNQKIGLISAFLFAIWITEARLSVTALHDGPMTFILLLSLYFFVNAVVKESNKYYVFSAIVLGIGSYIRSVGMLLPIFFGLALFLYNYKKQNNFDNLKNVFKKTAIMLLIVMIIFSPVGAHNYSVTGHVSSRTLFWGAVWGGIGQFENPVGAVLNDTITEEMLLKGGYKLYTPESEAFFKEKSINAIKEYPIWWVSTVLRRIPTAILIANSIPLTDPKTHSKTKNVSFIKSISNSDVFINHVKMYPTLFITKMLILMISLGLPLFAVIGIWLKRRNWREICLLISVPLYYVLTLSFLFIEPRFILPATSVFIIFSAITLDYIYTKAKNFMKGEKDILE